MYLSSVHCRLYTADLLMMLGNEQEWIKLQGRKLELVLQIAINTILNNYNENNIQSLALRSTYLSSVTCQLSNSAILQDKV